MSNLANVIPTSIDRRKEITTLLDKIISEYKEGEISNHVLEMVLRIKELF